MIMTPTPSFAMMRDDSGDTDEAYTRPFHERNGPGRIAARGCL
jgi:hypothetical protein